MSNCFVLGAGFTKGFTDQAPLMCDFLEKAKALGYFKPNEEHARLHSIIQRYYRTIKNLSIEDLATFLTRDTSSYWRKESCDEAFKQLVEVIVRYLGANVNPPLSIDSFSNKEKFLTFAKYLVNSKSDVISFNYDLVLDELLFRTKNWWVVDGYGEILPYLIPSNSGRIEMDTMVQTAILETTMVRQGKGIIFDGAQASYLASSAMRLFKLHGSINWLKKEGPEVDGRIQTYVQMPCSDHLMSQPSGFEPITGFPMQHVIIPPLLIKTTFYNDPLVRRIWQLARSSLTRAKQVHIIGYSFPESDFSVRHLFLEALASPPPIMLPSEKGEKCKIYFVNPTPYHAERVKDFFCNFVNCEFEFVQSNAQDYIDRFTN